MSIIKFKITNITCAACVKLSSIALEEITGVTKVMIDQATGLVELTADRAITWPEIVDALGSVGKKAIPST